MANWKNLIVNPPQELAGYFIFKIVLKEDENKWNFVHGCIKPRRDDSEPISILFPKEQSFNPDKDDTCCIHTVQPELYKYLYFNLQEVM